MKVSARTVASCAMDEIVKEMHPTVQQAVSIIPKWEEDTFTDGVEVRLSQDARQQKFGMIATRGESFMFQLRDAVLQVIETMKIPPEYWSFEEEERMPDLNLPGLPPLTEEHLLRIAKAVQLSDFPHLVGQEFGAAPQYIGEARKFVAALAEFLAIAAEAFPQQAMPVGSWRDESPAGESAQSQTTQGPVPAADSAGGTEP